MTKQRKILIVDASKVIRASLAKHLKDQFAICEESNGETAWQTLVLDNSIVAVFASHHLSKLDGIGLVERMRENKLSRLNSMPFFMLVSDNFSDDEKFKATASGVTELIPKMLTNQADMADTLQRLIAGLGDNRQAGNDEVPAVLPVESPVGMDSQFNPTQSITGVTDVLGSIGGLVGSAEGEGLSAPEIPPRAVIEERLERLFINGDPGQIGVLVFGLDGYDLLARRYGSETAEKVGAKFSSLLARKIRSEDSIGQLLPGRIAIIASRTNRALCTSFAERVCKALAAAQVSVRGRKIDMTVSVGVATVPEDGIALSGQDLLLLADGRLDAAIKAGGNRVISGSAVEANTGKQEEFLIKLKELLATVPPEALTPYLGNVGLQIMPILNQLEQAFHFGLPIDDMGKRLWARARAERMIL